MSLRIVTQPASEPVTLEEAKAHLNVTHADEDSLITTLIEAARGRVEALLQRAIMSQTWEIAVDCFPSWFSLPLGKVTALDSFTYVDAAGATQTVASSVYESDFDDQPARVRLADGQNWPDEGDVINAVRLRYTVGEGDAADVPAAIKQGILLVVGSLYRDRESQVANITLNENPTLKALLFPHIVHGT